MGGVVGSGAGGGSGRCNREVKKLSGVGSGGRGLGLGGGQGGCERVGGRVDVTEE